jgi:hypothetical protein
VTIVAAACLFLLFAKKGILNGILNAAFYGAISAIPMGTWVIRNYIVSGTLLGVRLPSSFTLRQNIRRTLDSIYTWVQPENLLSRHLTPLLLLCFKVFLILVPLLVFAAFLITLGVKLKKPANEAGGDNLSGFLGRNAESLLPIAFFAVFTVIYMVYLIASATKVAFEPINSRYLIPVYLPILLLLLTAADYIIRNSGNLHRDEGKGNGKSVKLFAMLHFLIIL